MMDWLEDQLLDLFNRDEPIDEYRIQLAPTEWALLITMSSDQTWEHLENLKHEYDIKIQRGPVSGLIHIYDPNRGS